MRRRTRSNPLIRFSYEYVMSRFVQNLRERFERTTNADFPFRSQSCPRLAILFSDVRLDIFNETSRIYVNQSKLYTPFSNRRPRKYITSSGNFSSFGSKVYEERSPLSLSISPKRRLRGEIAFLSTDEDSQVRG